MFSKKNIQITFSKNIKYTGIIIFLVVFSFLLNSLSVQATPDQELTYHGKLTDTDNVAVEDGNYTFTLTIYDAPTNGNCIWTNSGNCLDPQPQTVQVSKGIFSTILSNLNNLTFDQNYYLGVTIGNNAEMSPRKKITPTGFALNAHRLNGQQGSYYTTANNLTGTLPSTVLANSTVYIGTTGITLNRASGNQALTGITSIDGSAATLTTTRTLWGQNFNGSANVTGDLTSVGNITGTSAITLTAGGTNQNITLTPSGTGYTLLNGNVGIGTTTPTANLTVKGTTTNASLDVEQVTNGTFNTDATGWTPITWTWGTSRMNYTGTPGPIASGGITLNHGGTGYTNGDILTLTNGANNATITVTGVSSGKITGFTLSAAGTACITNASVSTTGGTGTGANFSIIRLVDSANTLSQNVAVTAGNTYQVTYTVTRTAGEIAFALGGVNGNRVDSSGTYTQNITASTTGNLIFTPTVNFTGSIDTVSVKKITPSTSVATILNSNGVAGMEVRAGGSGLYNTFIGLNAGLSNTTGINNTAFGAYALTANTTGNYNTASGYQVLSANTTGFNNTASGFAALSANTTGSYNTASGAYALSANTTGSQNTASGYGALTANTTGNYNTASGSYTLK